MVTCNELHQSAERLKFHGTADRTNQTLMVDESVSLAWKMSDVDYAFPKCNSSTEYEFPQDLAFSEAAELRQSPLTSWEA